MYNLFHIFAVNQYEQLSALHDLYKLKKAEVKPVSRCQSLMFSEFITTDHTSGPPSDVDANSIASEPAYLPVSSLSLFIVFWACL